MRGDKMLHSKTRARIAGRNVIGPTCLKQAHEKRDGIQRARTIEQRLLDGRNEKTSSQRNEMVHLHTLAHTRLMKQPCRYSSRCIISHHMHRKTEPFEAPKQAAPYAPRGLRRIFTLTQQTNRQATSLRRPYRSQLPRDFHELHLRRRQPVLERRNAIDNNHVTPHFPKRGHQRCFYRPMLSSCAGLTQTILIAPYPRS